MIWAIALFVCLAACNRGNNNDKEAVRQSVIQFVAGRGLNVQGMDVSVTSVQFNGGHADALIEFRPKGGPAGSGMSMNYQLEQRSGKWTVTGRRDSGSPHGAGAVPGGQPPMDNPHGATDNPHGGGMAAPAGGSGMPAPQDLPPVKKK